MRTLDRRSILRALAGSALALPLSALFTKSASGDPPPNAAKRLIVFYFPDGVPEPGGQHLWHPGGSGTNFTLSTCLQPLASRAQQCAFFRNLSLGPTDAGSHPGGAKKLLTGVDGGNGVSIDRYLSGTVGASAPFRHVYLGAMALQNNGSGDKLVSYVSPGTTVAPQDDPAKAFSGLFAGSSSGGQTGPDPRTVSILDDAVTNLSELRAQLGDTEKSKLDLHLDALRDTEKRVKSLGASVPGCKDTLPSVGKVDPSKLYDAGQFPDVLKAQVDVMVQSMACGLTRVGVIQASQHTSELIMSRFQQTPLYDPNYDMRSHQASHYGVSSDPKFTRYVQQRTWFVSQFAYLLDQLAARPEGQGTMLDNTLALLCTEVGDGNTHSHDDMGFVLAGAPSVIRTGRVHDFGYRRHADLLLTIARAMGDGTNAFGDSSSGVLPGVLV